MTNDESPLANLDNTPLNIDTYEKFVLGWQSFIDEKVDQTDAQKQNKKMRIVEQLTHKMLDQLVVSPNAEQNDLAVSGFFQSLKNSAIICDINGQVIHANNNASIVFGLHPYMNILDAGIEPEDGTTFYTKLVRKQSDVSSETNLFFIRCIDRSNSIINLVMTGLPMLDEQKLFLAVFITVPWDKDVYELLTSQFGLSDAEADISRKFATGIPLKQVAISRKRSYATVRNQFQSALDKTGCASQAELLRLLLGISYLFSQINNVADQSSAFSTKNIEILRPFGRFLEVKLLGDKRGVPVIFFSGMYGLPATPDIDQNLKDRGLLMLGVMRPGFGSTSPPESSHTNFDCLADDVSTLLDNLKIEKCVFMGRSSSARAMFNLENLVPDRIEQSYIVNALVPYKYIVPHSIASKWASSMIKASMVSPTIASFIVSAGHKVIKQVGIANFFSKAYATSEIDKALFLNPDIVNSFAQGIESMAQQGYQAAVNDSVDSFYDWSAEVYEVQKPVHLVQGCDDPDIPLSASRAFGKAFPEQINLIELEGGGLLNYSHAREVLDLVKQAR